MNLDNNRLYVADPTEIVSRTAFFSELNDGQLTRVAGICRPEAYAGDSPIYELGEPAEDFYILIDGMVRFSLGFGAMRTSAGEIIRCGEVFGWAALLNSGKRRLATAYCLSRSSVLAIKGDALLGLMDQDHTMGYKLMRQLNTLISSKLINFAAG